MGSIKLCHMMILKSDLIVLCLSSAMLICGPRSREMKSLAVQVDECALVEGAERNGSSIHGGAPAEGDGKTPGVG